MEGKRTRRFAGGEAGRGGESHGERYGSPRRAEGRGGWEWGR